MVEPNPVSDARQNCIRVLIADDYAAVRYGLEVFLLAFDDLQLVGRAVNGDEAVKLCGQVRPDVVLMDLLMPVMDGITATRLIKERYPEIKVIALASFEEEHLVQEALKAGAASCLTKNASIGELAEAIRAAGRLPAGRSSEQREVVAHMFDGTRAQSHSALAIRVKWGDGESTAGAS